MKMTKQLTIVALIAAGTALANAETEITKSNILPNFSSASDFAYLFAGSNITAQGSISADGVKTALTNYSGLISTGWHFADGQNKSDTRNDISDVTANSAFNFISRKNYSGEYVAATVKLSSLLNENQQLTGLNISFNYAASANAGIGFSVWSWDGTSVSQLSNNTSVSTGDFALSLTNLSLTSADTLFVVWNDNGAYAVNTISNLASSATIIPEPSAFGLLAGLGALALAGTRRRRKKA